MLSWFLQEFQGTIVPFLVGKFSLCSTAVYEVICNLPFSVGSSQGGCLLETADEKLHHTVLVRLPRHKGMLSCKSQSPHTEAATIFTLCVSRRRLPSSLLLGKAVSKLQKSCWTILPTETSQTTWTGCPGTWPRTGCTTTSCSSSTSTTWPTALLGTPGPC